MVGALSGILVLLCPTLLRGQVVAREALSTFPANTEQLAYTNLAELRSLPNYPQIRPRLFTRQLRDFQDFLRSMGMDPEKDVDEVALGWRAGRLDTASLFGLAEGRFQLERAREFFAQNQLPRREHAGYELYAFGSGEDPADLFFTFLSSSTAAFGRLSDLKAMLDVRAGAEPSLDSNATFLGWEAELEGTAPQWGIASGKAAAGQAAPWLGAGGKSPVDPSAFLRPVQGVLYRIDWSGGFTAHASIVCDTAENASALAKLLALWRDSAQTREASPPAPPAAFLHQLDIRASGARLELSGSGPIEDLDRILRPFTSAPTP